MWSVAPDNVWVVSEGYGNRIHREGLESFGRHQIWEASECSENRNYKAA